MFVIANPELTFSTVEEAAAKAEEWAAASGQVFLVAQVIGKVAAERAAPVISKRDAADKPVSAFVAK